MNSPLQEEGCLPREMVVAICVRQGTKGTGENQDRPPNPSFPGLEQSSRTHDSHESQAGFLIFFCLTVETKITTLRHHYKEPLWTSNNLLLLRNYLLHLS